MEKIEKIMEEYRGGDFGKRLDLYLQYRDLRRDFNLIDRKDVRAGCVPLSEPAMTSAYSLVRSVFRILFGVLKRSVT